MKNNLLKIVNGLLFLCFVVQFGGIILFMLIGLTPPQFYYDFQLHKNVGLALGILVLAHLWLNWAWIKNNVFKTKKKKA